MPFPVDPSWIELAAVAGVLVLSLAIPRPMSGLYRALRRRLDWLAERPARAIVISAIAAGLGSAAVALFVQWPTPRVHDEFSYLMAADTFAHGRLANPTHPMWRHLETFHVFFTPVYASKYPPGQGLWLAFGQVVFGEPAVSLWLGAAILCGSLAWMFQGWLAPRWAALASLLAVTQFGIGNYWTQSFWGGAVAATGGALAYGALPRIVREHRARDAFVLGIGLCVLANSRPFEGLVASLPIAAVLAVDVARRIARRDGAALVRTPLPIVCVLAVCCVWIARYDLAITGVASLMPYWVHDHLYTMAPPFLWMSLAPEPHYNHAVLKEYWTGFGLEEYTRQIDPSRLWETLTTKVQVFWQYYVGFLWTLPFAAAAFALRTPWIRLAVASVAFFYLLLLGETYTLAHYAAPIGGLFVVWIVAGLRRITSIRLRGRPVGRAFVAGLCVASLGSLGGQIVSRKRPHDAWDQVRARMQAELAADPVPDLVIVRYGPRHAPHDEWVFNAADIDAAPVVWARDMPGDENRELLAYFADRRAWMLEVDFDGLPARLTPYAP